MSKVCVVIPTYNEARNLPQLTAQIEKALENRDFSVVVVDDNSPDDTARIAHNLNHVYRNITVRIRKGKRGLGSAVVDGLKTALSMGDVEKIVTLDADMSHNPVEIPKLLCAAEETDLVQGSRYIEEGLVVGWSLRRRLVSLGANLICKLLLRASIHDCTGNFRVYSRKCAETLVDSTSSRGFEWVIEALTIAAKKGFSIKEVPITFIDRKIGRTKLSTNEILKWAKFVLNSSLKPNSQRPIFSEESNTAIHRLSAFSKASTSPTTSTTK